MKSTLSCLTHAEQGSWTNRSSLPHLVLVGKLRPRVPQLGRGGAGRKALGLLVQCSFRSTLCPSPMLLSPSLS